MRFNGGFHTGDRAKITAIPMIEQRPGRRHGPCGRAWPLLAALIWWLLVQPAWAGGERIDDLRIDYEDGRIVVSAVLKPGLTSSINHDIRKGISKDLYYYLVLKRRQNLWFDEEKAAVTIKHRIKFNLLKQEYVVTTRLPSGTTQTVLPDFESVRRLVSRVERVPVAETRQLQRRRAHLISVKAEMKAPQLPLYLDYFLFFIPFLEIDTPWADSALFRAPDGP